MFNSNSEGVIGYVKDKFENLFSLQKLEEPEKDYFVKCDNLVKIYQAADLEVFALQGLELEINKGEVVGIIGSSGSGKSTLLNILGGLDSPTAGSVKVGGWDLNNMSYRDKIIYKREAVGFVWQNVGRNLISYLTALENVRLPMFLGGNQKEIEWAKELLTAVGLEDRMKHRPAELSGGQQQRVAIAISLANKPDLVLADEPTGSLDSETGSEIFKVFKRVSEQFNVTVIVVTHDRSLASAVDRAVEIRDGKISTESVRNQVLSSKDGAKIGLNINEEEEEKTHTQYTVVDSAGRLQVPEEYLNKLGIKDRAALEIEEGEVKIKAPDENND